MIISYNDIVYYLITLISSFKEKRFLNELHREDMIPLFFVKYERKWILKNF